MTTRSFAMILGIVFLLIGIAGFIPAFLIEPVHRDHAVPVRVTAFEGYLFGLFHVNILHSLVHVLFGVLGVALAGRFDSARVYCRVVAISYAVLAIMGLVPGLNTVFGLIPIHGHDVWLHLVIAAAAAYFGWATVPVTRTETTEGRI